MVHSHEVPCRWKTSCEITLNPYLRCSKPIMFRHCSCFNHAETPSFMVKPCFFFTFFLFSFSPIRPSSLQLFSTRASEDVTSLSPSLVVSGHAGHAGHAGCSSTEQLLPLAVLVIEPSEVAGFVLVVTIIKHHKPSLVAYNSI